LIEITATAIAEIGIRKAVKELVIVCVNPHLAPAAEASGVTR
jgi:hypothetical protein